MRAPQRHDLDHFVLAPRHRRVHIRKTEFILEQQNYGKMDLSDGFAMGGLRAENTKNCVHRPPRSDGAREVLRLMIQHKTEAFG